MHFRGDPVSASNHIHLLKCGKYIFSNIPFIHRDLSYNEHSQRSDWKKTGVILSASSLEIAK